MAVAYEHHARNRRRGLLWAISLPISFLLGTWLLTLAFYLLLAILRYHSPDNIWSWSDVWRQSFHSACTICLYLIPFVLPLVIFWAWQAWKQGGQMLLDALRAYPMHRKLYDEIYKMRDNLCIRGGFPTPQLYMLDDDSLNAFAVGMNSKQSAIVLSRGAAEKLTRSEMEAVLAHELVHIEQEDPRAMAMLVMCVGFFSFAWSYLFYGEDPYYRAPNNALEDIAQDVEEKCLKLISRPLQQIRPLLIGVVKIYAYIWAPFLRAGVSASRELETDAKTVLLTRYPAGLRSALLHMDRNSRLEVLDNWPLLGVMCMVRPSGTPTFLEKLVGIYRAYPPLEKRLLALYDMD